MLVFISKIDEFESKIARIYIQIGNSMMKEKGRGKKHLKTEMNPSISDRPSYSEQKKTSIDFFKYSIRSVV